MGATLAFSSILWLSCLFILGPVMADDTLINENCTNFLLQIEELNEINKDLDYQLSNCTSQLENSESSTITIETKEYICPEDNSTVPLDSLVQITIKYCVYLVQHEEYEKARLELKNLDDYEQPTAIVVKQVFNSNLTNLMKVLTFIHYNTSCPVYATALSTLHNEMIESGFVTKPDMLTIAYIRDECKSEDQLQNLTAQIVQYTTPIIERFASKVRLGDTSYIYDYAKRGEFERWGMDKFLPELVQKSFAGNNSYFIPTLKFVDQFFYLSHTATGFQSLLNELKANGMTYTFSMFRLAYYARMHTIKYAEKIGKESYLKKAHNQIRNGIPAPIKNLMWRGNSCVIKNVHYDDEQLFMSAEKFGNGFNKVFTWTSGDDVLEGEWKINCDKNSDSDYLYCYITNNYWKGDNYLCQDTAQITDQNRFRVTVCSKYPGNNRRSDWSIYPEEISDEKSGEKIQVFTLGNWGNDANAHWRYVYAADDDQKNEDGTSRMVYTFKNVTAESYWKIHCH